MAAFEASLNQPLAASSASGEFSDYEQLKLDFVSRVSSRMKPEMLQPGVDWARFNRSAEQLFAVEISGMDAFPEGLSGTRMPGERAVNDFAQLHERYQFVPSYQEAVNAKLAHW